MGLMSKLYERGMDVRSAVLGKAHVERAKSRITPFTEDFQTFITEYAWGSIWTRPGLDRKARSILTIGMLAALGRTDELRLHIRATANTGVTRDEIKEILMQVAVYAGVPAANSAFHHAQEILTEMDKETRP
jgi:4-carboxymuconolactone decarboxylase